MLLEVYRFEFLMGKYDSRSNANRLLSQESFSLTIM